MALTIAWLGTTAASAGAGLGGGGGIGCHEPTSEGEGTVVELAVNCFTPTVLHVAAGDEVTFVNADPYEHNVGGATVGFNQLFGGEEVSLRFDEPGIHAYACTLHPGMTGAVVVGGATPAAAVAPTDDDDTSDAGGNGDGDVVPAIAAGVGGGALGLVIGRRRRPVKQPAPPT